MNKFASAALMLFVITGLAFVVQAVYRGLADEVPDGVAVNLVWIGTLAVLLGFGAAAQK